MFADYVDTMFCLAPLGRKCRNVLIELIRTVSQVSDSRAVSREYSFLYTHITTARLGMSKLFSKSPIWPTFATLSWIDSPELTSLPVHVQSVHHRQESGKLFAFRRSNWAWPVARGAISGRTHKLASLIGLVTHLVSPRSWRVYFDRMMLSLLSVVYGSSTFQTE